MTKIPTKIWTRTEWKKRRDKAKVPSGASKKVSMGPELDKFHKLNDSGKDLLKTFAQAQILLKKIDQYCLDVKKKHANWDKEIRENLVKSANEVLKFRTDIQRALTTIPRLEVAAENLWKGIRPGWENWVKEGNQSGLKNAETKELQKILMKLHDVHTAMSAVDPKMKKQSLVYGKVASKIGSDGVTIEVAKALVAVLK